MNDLEFFISRLAKVTLTAVFIVIGVRWLITQVGPWLPFIGLAVLFAVIITAAIRGPHVRG